MGDVLKRKCDKCKGVIEIDVDDIKDVAFFKKKYYHLNCLKELVEKKATNNRCSPDWKETLSDGFRKVQRDVEGLVNYNYGRDLIFNHLLNNYDVCGLSSYITKTLDSIVVGQYKGKSKPIPYRDFATCWIDIQDELDKIYLNNERFGKSMTGDQRIIYDIAVVVNNYPRWKNKKEALKVKAANRKIEEQSQININYTQIKTIKVDDGLGDISDLLDEI